MPIVIAEIAISSPPPSAPAEPRGGPIHIESFSWGVSQSGSHASHFDGRLLTADDLMRAEGTGSTGATAERPTLSDFSIVIPLEPLAAGVEDFLSNAAEAENGHAGGLNVLMSDGSVHFSRDSVDALLVADGGSSDETAIGANWRYYRVSVDSIE